MKRKPLVDRGFMKCWPMKVIGHTPTLDNNTPMECAHDGDFLSASNGNTCVYAHVFTYV